MRKIIIFGLCTFFLILLTLNVSGTTYYVNKSSSACNDTIYTIANTSNYSTPYCNLQPAIDSVRENGTIFIANGEYVDNNQIDINRSHKNLTIQGESWNVKLTSRMGVATHTNASNSTHSIWFGTYSTSGDVACYYNYSVFYPVQTYANLTQYNAPYPRSSWQNKSNNRVYFRLMPGEDIAKFNITCFKGNGNIDIVNSSFITIKDLWVVDGYDSVIDITTGSRNITLENLKVTKGVQRAIKAQTDSTNITIRNVTVYREEAENLTWSLAYNESSFLFTDVQASAIVSYDTTNVLIENNNVSGYFNGIVPVSYTSPGTRTNNTIIRNNIISTIQDDAIEIEYYSRNIAIYNNSVRNAFVGISLAPANCTSNWGSCLIENNTIIANRSIKYNFTSDWMGYGIKTQTQSNLKTKDWIFNHNTIEGLQYALKELTTNNLMNINFTNNLFSSTNDSVLQSSGNASQGVHYDYNNYHAKSGQRIFFSWNEQSGSLFNLTQAFADASNPGTWDNHSLDINPNLNNLLQPSYNNAVCGNASDGGDMGAVSCYSGIQINDTQHDVLGENQTIVSEYGSSSCVTSQSGKVRDGDWNTYLFTNGACSPSTINFVYNYNKPNVTLNQRLLAANLTYKDQYGVQLISILNSDTCFVYNTNYIQIGYAITPYCNNGTENITLYSQANDFLFYEQKVNWTVSQSNINLTEQTTPIYENNTLVFNAIQTNYPTFTTEVYIYNSTKDLIYTYSGTPNVTVILNFTNGIYFINATSYNATHYTHSNNVNYTWYSANTTITAPITNQNVTRYLNVSYLSSFTSNLVNVSYYNISILNSTGSLVYYIAQNNGVNTSFNDFFTYAQNTSTGIYTIKVSMFDTAGYWTHTQTTFNQTRNVLLNISARTALDNNTIANFSFNDFIFALNFNSTTNTTTGNLLLDSIRGNHTFIIDANQYFASENITTVNITNINVPIYTYYFYLYESNTLNISFYDQANPFTLLTGINISMDMFSDIYSNNLTTSNGTLYLTLLIPTTYTLRYSAPGYTQRFYEVTVDNRSYQNVNLYLINSSSSQNITITVIDEIGNPVEGAVVKALKYNLPTNTYIQQEIGVTNAEGKVIMHLTMNDEYYKFIVEVDGDVVKITDPAYITSTTYTIQISTGSEIGTEFTEYYTISHSLSFNTVSNNFRFDFTDSNNIASQFCLYIYQYNNFSSTTYNSSCTTDASGTILLGVAPINGTTYLAKSYYVQDGNNKQLGQLYHTFTGSTVLTTTYGLFLQFLVTGFFAFTGLVSMSLAAIITPFSLIIGKLIFLNSFSWNALIGLQVIGIIIAFMLTRTR